MKRINLQFIVATVVIAIGMILPTSAQAQAAPKIEPLVLPVTTIASTTTNSSLSSSNITFVVPQSGNVCIQPAFALTSSGTTAVVFRFDASANGSDWESGAFSVSVTPAGTTRVTKCGNAAINGIPFLRLGSIENPNANAVTNLTIWFSAKPGV